MAKFVVVGGRKLTGEINITGNKNAILPCLAACLLTNEDITLRNVANISDVLVMLEILKHLGAQVKYSNHTVAVRVKKIKTHILPEELVNKLRASILLAGPLLARARAVQFSHPGGDIIGKRSIDTHIKGFSLLGIEVSRDDRTYKAQANSLSTTLPDEIFLDEPSVTATENLIMLSSLNPKKITFKNCAKEPHIVDLCNMLSLMGVQIEGIGTSTLTIKGKEKLSGCEFTISQDFIEIGTYAVAAAITKGEIMLNNCTGRDLEPVTNPFVKMGVIFEEKGDGLLIKAHRIKSINKLITNIWPGFPTDLMSTVIVLATQAEGVSLLHDWMYESRMFFVDKLISMGANITIADPHRVFVYGPTKLHGRELESPDIRAGMALVLAALIAQGQSVINKAELIERGYADVVGNLSKLGAKIKRRSD